MWRTKRRHWNRFRDERRYVLRMSNLKNSSQSRSRMEMRPVWRSALSEREVRLCVDKYGNSYLVSGAPKSHRIFACGKKTSSFGAAHTPRHFSQIEGLSRSSRAQEQTLILGPSASNAVLLATFLTMSGSNEVASPIGEGNVVPEFVDTV